MSTKSACEVWREEFEEQGYLWAIKPKKLFWNHMLSYQSSVNSAGSDDSQDLFYHPFLSCPITFEYVPEIKITPRTFAEAFMEFDFAKRIAILSREIFTEDELKARNASNRIHDLPSGKIAFLKKISKYMDQKTCNPWDFTTYFIMEELTKDENEAVEKVLMNFSTVSAPAYTCRILELDEAKAERRQIEMGSCIFNYQDILKSITAECTYLGNPAQVVENLTKLGLESSLRDQFVDAVQFSKPRIREAMRTVGVPQKAYVLFKKYWKRDFQYEILDKYENFCPVKKLAINRLLAFLESDIGKAGVQFDSSINSHNLYLSADQIKSINSFINSKLEVHNIQHKKRIAKLIKDHTAALQNNTTGTGMLQENTHGINLPRDDDGDISFCGFKIEKEKWEEAVSTCRDTDGDQKKSLNLTGRCVYDAIFTKLEHHNFRRSSRKCPKGVIPPLPDKKRQAVFDALKYIRAIVRNERIKNCKLSDLEEDYIDTRIFTDYRKTQEEKAKRAASKMDSGPSNKRKKSN